MTRQLDARARRSQDALLKAGLELLNINSEATLSDIAAHAGVGRATLYRQYETREKLIHAIAVDCLETIDRVTAPIENQATSAMDAVRLLFELVMPLTQEFQFLIGLDQIEQDNAEIDEISQKQKQEMSEIVEYGKTKGEISQELPTSWVINLIEGLFYIGWLQQTNEGFSAKDAAKLAFSTFSQGVSSR
ncbi:MAG: TetR/AcrR family transcriptional regulator [Candidatus Thiodiazotropha endolucinida]